jgi:DNA-directed RNA polymerase subunit M/transcription elongation factor TFIIS
MIAPDKRIAQDSQTRYEPSVESFEEHGTIHADDEMDKEHREDYEVIVKKGLNPECPECGNALVYEEGCVKCHTCGYSEC